MKSVHGEVGNRIRQYRQRAGLSQEKLSLNAGITVSFLGDIERGNKRPTIESLEKLLRALDVSFVEFFDYENSREPLEDYTALGKITALLQERSNDEVEMLYGIIRKILKYHDMPK